MRIRGAHAAGVLFSVAGRNLRARKHDFQGKSEDCRVSQRAVRRPAEQYTRGRVCSPEVANMLWVSFVFINLMSMSLLKIFSSALRVTIAVAAILVLLWWFGMRMPGKNASK